MVDGAWQIAWNGPLRELYIFARSPAYNILYFVERGEPRGHVQIPSPRGSISLKGPGIGLCNQELLEPEACT